MGDHSLYWVPTRSGRFEPLTEEEHIRYCVRAILLSEEQRDPQGNQVGTPLRDFLYRPLNATLKSDLRHQIKSSVEAQETRIEIQTLTVESDPIESSKLLVQIQYLIRRLQKVATLKLALTPEGDAYGI